LYLLWWKWSLILLQCLRFYGYVV